MTPHGPRDVKIVAVTDRGVVRAQNEDTYLVDQPAGGPFIVGVFDGHGGSRVSQYLKTHLSAAVRKLLRQGTELSAALVIALNQIDTDVRASDWRDGSTVIVVVLTTDGRMITANIGDSEGFLAYTPLTMRDIRAGRTDRPLVPYETLTPLGTHNPAKNPYETRRIQDAGGKVINGRISVGWGSIAVSRAIGDKDYKRDCRALTDRPDLYETQLTGYEDFIIMASDGLWDGLNHREVFSMIRKGQEAGVPSKHIAKQLIREAYRRGSTDNITVVIINFTQ